MLSTTSLLFLATAALGSAAATAGRQHGDVALHPPARHPREPEGLSKPYRELPWNDVNFLSTSDTHGTSLNLSMPSGFGYGQP